MNCNGGGFRIIAGASLMQSVQIHSNQVNESFEWNSVIGQIFSHFLALRLSSVLFCLLNFSKLLN